MSRFDECYVSFNSALDFDDDNSCDGSPPSADSASACPASSRSDFCGGDSTDSNAGSVSKSAQQNTSALPISECSAEVFLTNSGGSEFEETPDSNPLGNRVDFAISDALHFLNNNLGDTQTAGDSASSSGANLAAFSSTLNDEIAADHSSNILIRNSSPPIVETGAAASFDFSFQLDSDSSAGADSRLSQLVASAVDAETLRFLRKNMAATSGTFGTRKLVASTPVKKASPAKRIHSPRAANARVPCWKRVVLDDSDDDFSDAEEETPAKRRTQMRTTPNDEYKGVDNHNDSSFTATTTTGENMDGLENSASPALEEPEAAEQQSSDEDEDDATDEDEDDCDEEAFLKAPRLEDEEPNLEDLPLAKVLELWNRQLTEPQVTDTNRYQVRNDLPTSPKTYDATWGQSPNKQTWVWRVQQPAASDVQRYNEPCIHGSKPALSGTGETLRGEKNPVEFLKMIITSDVINKILTYTNEYMEYVFEKRLKEFKAGARGRSPRRWPKLDDTELWAYFGALYYMGQEDLGSRSVSDLFAANGKSVHLPLMQAFPRERFQAITSFLRFHDTVNGKPNDFKVNRKLKIEQLLSPVVENCRKLITPSETLTVDESMLSFRGRCAWRQYLPAKPDKYGLKIFVICDSTTGAIQGAIPYVGKEQDAPEIGLCRRVVLDLVKPYENSHRTIVTDRYYTSPTLALDLWAKGLYSVGTLQPKCRGLPQDFVNLDLQSKRSKKVKDKPTVEETVARVASQQPTVDSSDGKVPESKNCFVFRDQLTLVKYEPRPGKKIHLLSTKHHSPSVAVDGKKKPEIVNFYNSRKFGVDLLDQLVKNATTKRISCRWPMRVFFWALDIAAVQAFVAYRLANKDIVKEHGYRRKFMDALSENLMQAQISRRRQSMQKTKHMKNLLDLEYDLRKLQRKPTEDQSAAMRALKETLTIPERLPKRLFGKDTALMKRKRSRGFCYALDHCQKRKSEFRCDYCLQWICMGHRRQVGNPRDKRYACLDSVATPCTRG